DRAAPGLHHGGGAPGARSPGAAQLRLSAGGLPCPRRVRRRRPGRPEGDHCLARGHDQRAVGPTRRGVRIVKRSSYPAFWAGAARKLWPAAAALLLVVGVSAAQAHTTVILRPTSGAAEMSGTLRIDFTATSVPAGWVLYSGRVEIYHAS